MPNLCLGCGTDLRVRHARVFCSNACQQNHQRRLRLEAWLETGICGRTSYRGHFVREYLAAEQGNCCAVCGMTAEWNGAELAFIIDHVDGDATNNRRNNLRLVCPNCDSQLPTYKGRNRGSGRHYRRKRYADGRSY